MKIKEKLKNNKTYNNFKEKKDKLMIIWNNPKYHASILLAFWFLIILIFSILVRLENNKVEKQNNNEETNINEVNKQENHIKDNLFNITSYNATITLELDNYNEIIEKTTLNNEYIIKYQNNIYYYKDNLYNINNNEMIIDNNEIVLDLNYFNEKNIYNLIKDKQEEYITTYKDNSFSASYKINAQEFMLNYKGITIESNEFVNIIIEGNEDISKIIVDMSYISNFNGLYKKVILDLRNINQINNINLNK